MLQETYPELQKPVARLIAMSADEVIRAQKDSWDKARWDEAARKHHAEIRAKAEGKAEGKAEARTEVAINLLRQGLSSAVIADATGLSLEEIAALPA
ncbi:hypothetical protein AGMMS50256_13720 [Betaproteobacteria bacterium]|nr:hypothetical protein AGMMS50256_13720 [Betaproteobacteria bacterium]